MSLDFFALDVETANSNRGSICAVGWAVVRNGVVVDSGSFLCRPPASVDWFSEFNTRVHGIRAAAVVNQPSFAERLPELLATLGDLPVVAHNAAFDIGAIRDACGLSELEWPTLTYGCSLVWSRRLLDLPSHRLPVVCEHLGIGLDHHHDAGADAHAVARVVLSLAEKVGAMRIADLTNATRSVLGQLAPTLWAGCKSTSGATSGRGTSLANELPVANLDADPDNPFFGQTVVFTGTLMSMNRTSAWECVATSGGGLAKGVTKKTTMLVLGDGFVGDSLGEFLGTEKAAKALKLRERGQPIEFLSEADFVAALSVVATSDRDRRILAVPRADNNEHPLSDVVS